MKRILITGGAGFIGSHLCERLLQEGNEILCLDNYFTGSKKNITQLLDNPYFELIRHDVTTPYYVELMKYIILPVRLLPYIISTIPSRLSKLQ